ncbi:MAG: hypothetical protein HQL39_15450 [Alphaproteobacteria bacterium]|nr:hypothetical protein [Alphaproteobacteria bacterium]
MMNHLIAYATPDGAVHLDRRLPPGALAIAVAEEDALYRAVTETAVPDYSAAPDTPAALAALDRYTATVNQRLGRA